MLYGRALRRIRLFGTSSQVGRVRRTEFNELKNVLGLPIVDRKCYRGWSSL